MVAQRKHPPELQERAVAMYRAADPKPVIRQTARQLGVHPEALRNCASARSDLDIDPSL